jgi:hypothetical protein
VAIQEKSGGAEAPATKVEEGNVLISSALAARWVQRLVLLATVALT